MRTVAEMVQDPDFGSVTQIEYRTKQGNSYLTYQLDKRQSIAVVALVPQAIITEPEAEPAQAKPAPKKPEPKARDLAVAAVGNPGKPANVRESLQSFRVNTHEDLRTRLAFIQGVDFKEVQVNLNISK